MSTPPWGAMVHGNAWDDPRAEIDAAVRTVSVVVTHFEQLQELERTLAALAGQTRPPSQVVVADDGSRVPPAARPGVEVVTQPDRGFRAAAARNRAVERCRGDLVVLLDADTTPEPTFLERLTAPLLNHPELLVVGRRRHEDRREGRLLDEPHWLRQGYEETDDLRRADVTSYRYVISAVMACSRWWFEEIGGFDERFDRYGGEDWELAHRSWCSGGLVAHVPGAVAWHDGPAVGERGRPLPPPGVRLEQTAAVAARVGAPGACYRGLWLGPPQVVVTVAPDLGATEVVVTLDSLLAAMPRARVVLVSDPGTGVLDDPRVEVAGADAVRPASWLDTDLRLHLHLTRAVTGGPEAWSTAAAAADGVDPAARTVVLSSSGRPCAVLHDLRQYRRARRWAADPSTLSQEETASALQDATGRTLQSWLQT